MWNERFLVSLLLWWAHPSRSFRPADRLVVCRGPPPRPSSHRWRGYERRKQYRIAGSADGTIQLEYGLQDRFDRWRWLQQLLDEETDPDETNRILYQLLAAYLKNPTKEVEGSPELSPARRAKLDFVVQGSLNGKVDALAANVSALTDVYQQLEQLLPDPQDEEDAFKSLWDIVIELHGRESVKINERDGRLEWKRRCLVARVLLHYDFLTRGIPAL